MVGFKKLKGLKKKKTGRTYFVYFPDFHRLINVPVNIYM